MMSDLLNIPLLRVLNYKCTDKYYINAEATGKPKLCPHCGIIAPAVIGHGHKPQIFHDLPIHGMMVGILIDRRRYRCLECNKTFLEPLSGMDTRRNITLRLLRYIEENAVNKTFTSLADEVGLSEATIRRIFHDYFTERLKHYHPEIPRWLGIDEAHLLDDYRCVLTNIEESCVLDMLKNRNKVTVVNYLYSLPNKDGVEFVCMDMWQPCREAVECCLPKARIIVDKYHVVRGANKALDDLRKVVGQSMTGSQRRKLMHSRFLLLKRFKNLDTTEQFKLDTWLCQQPLLKRAYDLKEEFFDIFDSSETKLQAMSRYAAWAKAVSADPALHDVFKTLITSMTNWRVPIFNHFDTLPDNPLTNAFTESLNGIIKHLNRTGKGYSFTVLRAKILFYSNAEKTKTIHPAYTIDDFAINSMLSLMVRESYQKRIYGIHIPTLLKYLEREAKIPGSTRCDE
jgi:transposase